MSESKKILALPEEISVRALASALEVDPTKVISKLITNGIMVTINQSIDYDTAALLAEEFGFTAEAEVKAQKVKAAITGKHATARAPIITIMGHVDHGKTSLLDYIRSSNIAAGESGGITQHISAYQIDFSSPDHEKRKITFIDTPGHEAFSALRSHGASLTDIVILVVAADDGVKPQTLEALKHAQEAHVPVVVAINKTDLPGANVERVKQQLGEHDLVPEEWGGKTSFVPISAKTGDGVDKLLEIVLLTTDLLELKADPEAIAEGIVIEANLDKQVGPLATVLIYNGTLRPGQVVVIGKTYGRIRVITDDRGNRLTAAGPATPVQIQGLKDVPTFGERLEIVPNEKVARTMTQTSAKSRQGGVGEDANTYKVIIKADVGGSLAALEDSIGKLNHKDATVEIIASGIGSVTENDVNLAKTAHALVIAFRTPLGKRMKDLAEKEEVILQEHWVIYDAIEFLQKELKRIANPVFLTIEIGRLKVLEVFSRKGTSAIVGGEVTEGEVKPGLDVVINRHKEEVGKAKIGTLKIGKMEVTSAAKGDQCGMSVEEETPIEKGDMLVLSETHEE